MTLKLATRETTRGIHRPIIVHLLGARQQQSFNQVEVAHRCRAGETVNGAGHEHRVATTRVPEESRG